MAKPAVITAIDLGTDKCITLIAAIDPETKGLGVLGMAASVSRGVKKSQIVDLEQVQETITESLDAAERMAGLEVHSAYFSLSGAHISSQNSKGVVAVAAPNQEIASDDVARVIEAARAISLPADREVLHVIPHDFTVDAQTGIKDPIGMTGIRLETETHIITAMSTALRNVTKCAHDLGLEVDGIVFSGLAASEVVLTETEKELGVVLIDIGAGSTAVCAYVEGALTYSAVFPVGARHITQDIALGCRVSLDSAEKIKLALSQEILAELNRPAAESKEALAKRKKQDEKLDVSKLNLNEQVDSLSKKTLIEGIMVPRIKEVFVLIGKELQKNNLFPLIPAGFVLTGGGAETIGMVEVAKRTLNLPARIGKPMVLQGMIEDIHKPSFATSIGLLYYAKQKGSGKVASKTLNIKLPNSVGDVVKPIVNFFKSLIP